MPELSAFLPKSCWDMVAPGATRRKTVEGSVLFCDVAGFTPLTEALMVMGREGSEELTRLLNDYFACMVGIVEEEGGDILRFGGDAMAVLFPGRSRTGAVRAASRMMAAMERFSGLPTRAGTFSLKMKIGAAHGRVSLGLLSDGQGAVDFYAAGAPLDGSAEAEHHAAPGQVVCHRSFLAGAGSGERGAGGEKTGAGSGEWGSPLPPVSPRRGRKASFPAEPEEEALRRAVPAYLQEEHGRGAVGEHRGVAVLFVSLAGLTRSAGEEGLHGRVTAAFGVLAEAARRYGGVLNKVDMGDKGAKALLLFGAPYALEHREEMALRAAMDLTASTRWPLGVRISAGVTSSQLFTGPVGARQRREYTAMGDGINLAARLMQHARPGQVLCERACCEKATALRFKELAALTVKGKKAPIEVVEPLGEAEDKVAPRQALAEREEACQRLEAFLNGPGGRALILEGEAGLGKTALLDWLAALAAESGEGAVPVHRMNLGPYSQEHPYAVWRGPMRAVTGVRRGDPPEALRKARDAAFEREPTGYRVLLNPLLDLPAETSASVRNLSPKERKDLTFAMLGRAFKAAAPRLLLCDNLHYADPLSLELLAFLLEEAEEAPWRLVGALRPSLAPAQIPERLEHCAVEPLSPKGVEALLQEAHDLSHVPKEVLAWFSERSGGNPALVGALVTAVDAAGLLVRDEYGGRVDQDRLFKTAFPDTLEGLYLARLDRLSAHEREVLQYASILGASVSVNLLHQLSGQSLDALHRVVRALEGAGLLLADSWGKRPYRRFADALLRDAVYHALPFAFKRKAHLALAKLLDFDAEKNPKLWPVLAQHYEQGGDDAKARRFHRLAGRDAQARYDNMNALRHLEFVCKILTPGEQDVEDAFSLMDVYGFLGRWADAKPILSSLSAMEDKILLRQQARLQNFLSRDCAPRQDLHGAENALLRGITLAKEAKDYATQGKAYVNLVGFVYGPMGRLEEAKEALNKALALPRGPNQAGFRTLALMNLGVVNLSKGDLTAAEVTLLKAYRCSIHGFLGPQQGTICGNLGAFFNDQYRFDQAVRWCKKAECGLETFAIRGTLLQAREILAAAYLALGHAKDATSILAQIEHEAAILSNPRISALANQGLAKVALLNGNIDDFNTLQNRALDRLGPQSYPKDIAYAFYEALNFYQTLAIPKKALQIAERINLVSFLTKTDLPADLKSSLMRLANWAHGRAKATLSLSEMVGMKQSCLPEDLLEAHLLLAVRLAEEGKVLESGQALRSAKRLCQEKPLFESQLRLLQVRVRVAGKAQLREEKQARRLLARCHGGIHGTRLACQMALVSVGRKKTRWLKDARARLAVLEANSPGWAWQAIRKFPEVSQVLALAQVPQGNAVAP